MRGNPLRPRRCTTSMRTDLARSAGLTAALLSALLLTAAPAAAKGGPTSALLSVPGAGTTSSLYYTDPEYDELAGLVGMNEPGGTFDGEKGGAGHELGAGVTVTWLIHDVSPWRVDRIYLGGKDGPWISTQAWDGTTPMWGSPVVWHQPADGARLAELLGELGLGTEASKDPGFDGVAGAPVSNAPAAAASEPTTAAGDAWIDALGGAAGGLAVGALLTLMWTRRRRGNDVEQPQPSRPGSDGYAEVLSR